MILRRAIALALIGVGAACGSAYSGEDTTPSTNPDAGPDAVIEATCDALDFRRALVLVADAESCPAGTTERLLVTGGSAMPGACGCGTCTTTKPVTCGGAGAVSNNYGSSNACTSGTETYVAVVDGACVGANGGPFDASAYNKWMARTPTAGACTAASVADPAKVVPAGLRACTPSSQAAVCAAIDARQRLCTESLGGGCGGDFALALDAGDGVAATCSACGCTLASPTCTVEYHGNATCTELKFTATMNGVCTRTNDAVAVSHLKFGPSAPICTTTPGEATISVSNRKTYCCTP